MVDVRAGLPKLLQSVRRPGDFYACGVFDLVLPAIDIQGFGPLALPVLPDQAARLISSAAPAPFGRGEATIIDQSVRRSWQIEPDHITIAGRRWAATLAAVTARAALDLGVEEAVEAQFHKLLVYDAGSFFVDHRDTEKSPGMFATLLIALPSLSTGGDLVVKHAGREARIDMRGADPGEAHFAAFYADCIHEIRPVESGCRLSLVYNLIRTRRGKTPEPPRYDREKDGLVALLEAWCAESERAAPRDVAIRRGDPADSAFDEDDDDEYEDSDGDDDEYRDDEDDDDTVPAKLVYPLAHAYTPADIDFASLKGADAAAAQVLIPAAARARCDLHLALLTIEETGSAAYSGNDWRNQDEDDYEIDELIESSARLTLWRSPDGTPCTLGDMLVEDDEFSPADAKETMTPDEQHVEVATGNEGASLERTYRRAALVLWPRAGFLPMIAGSGRRVSLPYLGDLARRFHASAGDARAQIAADVAALADAMIAVWSHDGYRPDETLTTSTTIVLELLAGMGAAEPIRRFLLRRDAGSGRKADNAAVIDALAILPPPDRIAIVTHMIQDAGQPHFAVGADLLARAARAWPDLQPGALGTAARHLLGFCPGDGATNRPHMRRDPVKADTVVALVGPLGLAEPDLAGRFVDRICAAPKTFGMDSHIVPALCELVAAGMSTPAAAKLRDAGLAHLNERIARPLAPPSDWRRTSGLTCTCADCTALSTFLDDPATKSWSLKAVQGARSHVEATIMGSKPDVDTRTERKGSPHRLIVTKNQNSYERLAVQRTQDLDRRARIERGSR